MRSQVYCLEIVALALFGLWVTPDDSLVPGLLLLVFVCVLGARALESETDEAELVQERERVGG